MALSPSQFIMRPGRKSSEKAGAGFIFTWLHFGLAQNYKIFRDWKSAILEVWAAPGALEIIQKGGGEAPHLFGGSPRPPGSPRPQKSPAPNKNQNSLTKCSHEYASLKVRPVHRLAHKPVVQPARCVKAVPSGGLRPGLFSGP
jgi:hypothetical protein